jgi:hypothetical protein
VLSEGEAGSLIESLQTEIKEALDEMKVKSTPAQDGLPSEFLQSLLGTDKGIHD